MPCCYDQEHRTTWCEEETKKNVSASPTANITFPQQRGACHPYHLLKHNQHNSNVLHAPAHWMRAAFRSSSLGGISRWFARSACAISWLGKTDSYLIFLQTSVWWLQLPPPSNILHRAMMSRCNLSPVCKLYVTRQEQRGIYCLLQNPSVCFLDS